MQLARQAGDLQGLIATLQKGIEVEERASRAVAVPIVANPGASGPQQKKSLWTAGGNLPRSRTPGD